MAAIHQMMALNRPRRARQFKKRVTLVDYAEYELLSRYRLDRQTIMYLEQLLGADLRKGSRRSHAIEPLTQLLGADLRKGSRRSHAIEPLTQILVSLRYLAKAAFFSEVGDLHGVSRASVSRILATFAVAVCQHLDNIEFPRDQDVLKDLKLAFYQKCKIPDVIGAVDGTLIPIIAPSQNPDIYICRKGYPALNVQAVVDNQLRFLDVVSRWPGSTHDASVLDSCGLKEHLSRTREGHLLGDGGYPLREYLMTPVPNPGTNAEQSYNNAHARGRVVVERAFGILKSRFRCLHKTGGCLPFRPARAAIIVEACMRLHNLCIVRDIPLIIDDDDDDNDDDVQHAQMPLDINQVSGAQKRQKIIALF